MDLTPADYLAWKRRNGMAVGGPDDPENQTTAVRLLFGAPQRDPVAAVPGQEPAAATVRDQPVGAAIPPLPSPRATTRSRADPGAWMNLPDPYGPPPTADRVNGPNPFPGLAHPMHIEGDPLHRRLVENPPSGQEEWARAFGQGRQTPSSQA